MRCANAAKAAAKPAAIVVTFEAIEGPYTGQAYVLRPSEVGAHLEAASGQLLTRAVRQGAAKIGRSTGKLFKTRGISMPEDQEVSTTHAKVEVLDDQPVLIDVGSTNGTFYNGCATAVPWPSAALVLTRNAHHREDLEEHKPLPLATGQEIGIGQTVFRVTIAIE